MYKKFSKICIQIILGKFCKNYAVNCTDCCFELKLGQYLHIHGIHQKSRAFFKFGYFFNRKFCQFLDNTSMDFCETLSDYSP